jgi:hypothetical protein
MIERGKKVILSTPNGRSSVEVKFHMDPILDNIVIINSTKNKKYENVWIISKDLESWISKLLKEGYTEIKIENDVEASKKNKKKKNG